MPSHKVSFGYKTFTYDLPWDGTRLYSSLSTPIAFDTETEVVDVGIPRLALATVSNGTRSALLHQDQIARFITAHANSYFVGHNFAFDFWVIDQHLRLTGEDAARRLWWDSVDDNRVFDTMILDMLVRIARGDGSRGGDGEGIWARNLAQVASEYAKMAVDKEDPYRMRYAEIIGVPFSEVEQGFFDYAIKDAIATAKSYGPLAQVAQNMMRPFMRGDVYGKEVYDDAPQRFGLLTQSLQVKASVALHSIEKTGICVDHTKVSELQEKYSREVEDVIEFMLCSWPELFKPNKIPWNERRKMGKDAPQYPLNKMDWVLKRAEKSGVPSMNQKPLVEILESVADALDIDPPMSDGKTGGVSKSVKAWAEHADYSTFLQAWKFVVEDSKLLGFLSIAAKEKVLRSRYGLLKLTGRTGCSGPNLQQWPKRPEFRAFFVPRPGYKMMSIDFSAVELCTLAAVCKRKFGRSVLAEVIASGVDTHSYTASMLVGMSVEQFSALKNSDDPADRKFFKLKRQASKAISFGVPGGLGPAKLSMYARTQYGVDLTEQEAEDFRHKLIYEIYPELSDKDGYLADRTWKNLEFNTGVPEKSFRDAFEAYGDRALMSARSLGKVLKGKARKFDGTAYNSKYVSRIWDKLNMLLSLSNKFSGHMDKIRAREGSMSLFSRTAAGTVPSLTGRLRGGVDFTQIMNTPFQALAADGGKMALWNLLKAGFIIVGWVHDEALLEIPEEAAAESALEVKRIMESSMSEVLNHQVPVKTEYNVGDWWIKD